MRCQRTLNVSSALVMSNKKTKDAEVYERSKTFYGQMNDGYRSCTRGVNILNCEVGSSSKWFTTQRQ